MPTSDAQKRAVANYNRHNIKTFTLQMNVNTDKDVIKRLDEIAASGGSKGGYIKRLIREDVAREGGDLS